MGLKFEYTIYESPLWIEWTITTFKLSGKTSCWKDLLIFRDGLGLKTP